MIQSKLDSQGITASDRGFGCMGMSQFYGTNDNAASIETLHRAFELGINLWDTGDAYGPYLNEVM